MPVAERARRRKSNSIHPAKVREFCRRLYQDYERTPSEIRKQLADRGYEPLPGWATILCWADPEYNRSRLARARSRHAQRRGGELRRNTPKRGWHYRLERLEELRSIGISYRAIAALMSYDFDLELTAAQVEYLLKEQPKTETIKRLLWPQGSDA